MAIQTIPYALQNASHPAAVFRQASSGPYVTGGILASGELAVSQQASPNMSIVLGPGRAKVVGTSVSPPSGLAFTTQAMYDTLNDANLTLTIATSNATNPRIDSVYLQIQDSFYSGATNTAVASVATGTPAVTPVAPSIPANSILIANIAVAANATTIVTANIGYQAVVASLIPSPAVGSTRIIPTSAVNATIGTNGNVTFSGQTTISINGCFTTGYDNYEIELVVTSAAASAGISLKFRVGGVDANTNYNINKSELNNAGTQTPTNLAAQASAPFSRTGAGGGVSAVKVFSPALVANTRVISLTTDNDFYGSTSWITHATAAAYDGITIVSTQVFAGVIRIRGINNN